MVEKAEKAQKGTVPPPKNRGAKAVAFREPIQMFGISASGWNAASAHHISCHWDPSLPYIRFTCDQSDDEVLVSYASIKSVTVG